MADEDLGGVIAKTERSKRVQAAQEQLEAFESSSTPDYVQTEEETPDDEFALGEGAPPMFAARAAVAQDVGRGLLELPLQLVGGVRDATQNTFNALDSMSMALDELPGGRDWVVEQLGQPTTREIREEATGDDAPEQLPEVPEPTTMTGQGARSIAQFVTGFIPAIKGVQAVSGGQKALTGLSGFLQTEAAAALSSALVFDPHEERLSNMIESVPELQNPITDYLAADENDSEAEGRFKNAVEGFGLGVVANSLFGGLRAIKANRVDKGLDPTEPIGNELTTFRNLGDPNGDLVVPATEGKLPFQMNWARYTRSEDIEDAVRQVAKMYTGQIDEARRGTMAEAELQKLAGELGVTPEDLVEGRFKGGAYRAEEILAMRNILEDSTDALIKTAEVARNSADPEDLFSFRKMMDIHSGIQAQFQGAASEAGRSLRALQIPSGSRERQLLEIESQLMKGQSPDQVRQLANAVSEVNDPNQIRELARRSMGKRMSDAVVEWWYFALLSGPRTHAVNITTSAMNAAWQVPERALAAGFRSLRGGGDGVRAGESLQMLYGFVNSLPSAFKMAGKTFRDDTPADIFSKAETRVPSAISSENFPIGQTIEKMFSGFAPRVGRDLGRAFNKGIDGLGTIVRSPTRFIMSQDSFFQTIGKEMEMRALSYRKAMSEGLEGEAMATRMQQLLDESPPEMMQEAENFSRSLTFTDRLGRSGEEFQQFTNRHPALKIALPFVRTPINLLKWAGKRSPLALASKEIRRDIASGGAASDTALARMTMGSMAGAMAADFALKGLATGAGPSDPALRQTWLRDNQPFSVKVGDTWYSYNRSDPFGLLLGAAASYAEIAGPLRPEEREEIAGAIAVATSRAVVNKTWLIGVTEALDALTQPDRHGQDFVKRTIGTFLVPTGAAQVAGTLDPVWRETETLIDEMKSRVPGYSDDLPAHRNLWGQPISYEGGLGPDIISPIMKYGEQDRPIDEWMFENNLNISLPSKTQSGAELTPQQYSQFVELAGNEAKDPLTGLGLYDTLNGMIEGTHPNSSTWELATDGPNGGRARIVRSLVSAFRERAKAMMMQDDADFRSRVEKKANENARALQETIMNPSAGEAE